MNSWRKPLAYRMRPSNISEVVGQQHLLATGMPIYNMVKANYLPSMILYGNPGIGKTSLVNALSKTLDIPMEMFNASTDNKKKLQEIIKVAETEEETRLLFVDEIHRMTNPIMDYLLPFVENGLIVLIGATTENPFFAVNKALLSRTKLIELKPLDNDDIVSALKRALKDKEKGLGWYEIVVDDSVLNYLAMQSHGDLRTALNVLELSVLSHSDVNSKITLTLSDISKNIKQGTNIGGENDLYNTMSAFQKSLRGSSVDGSLHYLARLLYSGELENACRRLVICAYEDVGIANPQLMSRIKDAIDTALKVGMPEARIPLSVAVIELALSPKSNTAYLAINEALSDIETKNIGEIPNHLKDAHYTGASKLGVDGYLYPHSYKDHFISQKYLPDNLLDSNYLKENNVSSNIEKDYLNKYNLLKEKFNLDI